MVADDSNITDVEAIDAQEVVHHPEAPTTKVMSPQEIQQYFHFLKMQHNAKCRKKGFKDHIHQPAGNKLKRKLERQGSLYGRVSTVMDAFNEMQKRAFRDAKAAA